MSEAAPDPLFSDLAAAAEEPSDDITPNVPDPEFDPTAPTAERARAFDFIAGTNRARAGRPRKVKAEKPSLPKMRANSHPYQKPLTDLYTAMGTMIMMFDAPCGGAVVSSAEKCAIALEDLARDNEAVRRAIESMITTSVWGAVLAAHAPILMAIAMHHNPMVRDSLAGAMGRQAAEQAERYAHGQEPPAA